MVTTQIARTRRPPRTSSSLVLAGVVTIAGGCGPEEPPREPPARPGSILTARAPAETASARAERIARVQADASADYDVTDVGGILKTHNRAQRFDAEFAGLEVGRDGRLEVGLLARGVEHLFRVLASTSPVDFTKRGELNYENQNNYLVGRVVGTQWMAPFLPGQVAYQRVMRAIFRTPELQINRARLPEGDVLRDDEAIPHTLAPVVVASERSLGLFDESAYTGNHVIGGAWGGWAMAAIDLTRFLAALGWTPPLLGVSALDRMTTPGGSREARLNVAFGTYRKSAGKVLIDHHNGGMPGFSALQCRIHPNPVSGTTVGGTTTGPGGGIGTPTGGDPTPKKKKNAEAPKSTWVVSVVINSSIPDEIVGRSFDVNDAVSLWNLIHQVSEVAWPTEDLFAVADETWELPLKTAQGGT